MTNITPFILAIYKDLSCLLFTNDSYYVIIVYMEIKELKIVGDKGEVLKAAVPKLKSFHSRSGAEGIAFFVGKEYIIKYFERVGLKYDLFNNYCAEIKSFGDAGFNYPKVYSWATSPICVEDNVFRFYILEEQISGKELYPHSLFNVEKQCTTFCSKKEFDAAIENAHKHKSLYEKIMEEYIRQYIAQNKQLAEISREEVLRFVQSYFAINRDAKYVIPDMHPGNVIFDGTKLTMIDGTMCEQKNKWLGFNGDFKEKKYKLDSFFDIMALLSSNKHVSFYLENYMRHVGIDPTKELLKLGETNKKYATEVVKKFVKETQKHVAPFPMTELDLYYLFGQVDTALTAKGQKDVWRELER